MFPVSNGLCLPYMMHLHFKILRRFRNTYNKPEKGAFRGTIESIFGKYLIVTNTLTCGGLLAAGDAIQQESEIYRGERKVTSDSLRYDFLRIGQMFTVGLAQGPPQHYFYKWLEYVAPKKDLASLGKKIFLDQLIASPMCLFIFFFGLGYLEGRKPSSSYQEMKSKFLSIYKVDWIVWPPCQLFNFYYLPPKYRVLYINIVTMLYDVFLSYMKYDVVH